MSYFNPNNAFRRRKALDRAQGRGHATKASRSVTTHGDDGFVSASVGAGMAGFRNARGTSYGMSTRFMRALEKLGYMRMVDGEFRPTDKAKGLIRDHESVTLAGEYTSFLVFSQSLVEEVRPLVDEITKEAQERAANRKEGIVYPEGYEGHPALCKLLGVEYRAYPLILQAAGMQHRIGGKWVPTRAALEAGHAAEIKVGKDTVYCWNPKYLIPEVGAYLIANPSARNLGND